MFLELFKFPRASPLRLNHKNCLVNPKKERKRGQWDRTIVISIFLSKGRRHGRKIRADGRKLKHALLTNWTTDLCESLQRRDDITGEICAPKKARLQLEGRADERWNASRQTKGKCRAQCASERYSQEGFTL